MNGQRFLRNKYGLTGVEATELANHPRQTEIVASTERWREQNGLPAPSSPLTRGFLLETLRGMPDTDACTPEVRRDLTALVADLIATEHWPDFEPGGDCHDPDDPDPSGLCLTVGTDDGTRWGYQTGDNSYTGGAYGSRHWAVVWLYQDSEPADVVEDIVGQWADLMAQDC